MHIKYNNRKNGLEDTIMPLDNIEDIVGDTFGTIIFQEQIMAISKRVAKFDDNQADSYLRKGMAKKKADKMALCKRWFIYGKINKEIPVGYNNENPNSIMYDSTGKYGTEILGGINNGYTKEELENFWHDIEGFATYLFNKSHAACYGYITLLEAYLKKYYPIEFFASLLSIQDDEDKRKLYIDKIEDLGIKVLLPDINSSNKDFTSLTDKNAILYGLGSIKGIGNNAIEELINNRPYNSLEEILEKVPKKAFNKRVGIALIKSGALDFINTNRNLLIDNFYDLRKDKDERLNIDDYNKDLCMEYEKTVLGTSITYKPWWNSIEVNQKVTIKGILIKNKELIDRNGNMMSFITLDSEGCIIEGVVFARTYCKNADKFEELNKEIILKGKKDEKGQLIVSSVL